MGCGKVSKPAASNVAPSTRRLEATCRPRRELIPDFGIFAAIDDHVRNTPAAATRSLPELAAHLVKPATSDLMKIRAIYKWIALNIEYDADGLFGRRPRAPTDAESVLANRRCVCDGYASLACELFQIAGIEAKKLVGHSKGFGYNPAKPLTERSETDHAWNAVSLDGEWRLMDCTWGAGHLTAVGSVFQRHETEFYFLTDPEIFVDSHFPRMDGGLQLSMGWQLLSRPIDLATFSRQVKRSEHCFEFGLELTSHHDALIDVHNEVQVTISATDRPLASFSASLTDVANPDEECGDSVVAISDRRTAIVTVRPQHEGRAYQLDLFAAVDKSARILQHVVAYILNCKTAFVGKAKFPKRESCGLGDEPEKYGFLEDFPGTQGFSLKSDSGHLQLKLATTRAVNASCTFHFGDKDFKDFFLLQHSDDFLEIRMRMPQVGFYILNLFCGVNPDSERCFLAKFLVECTKTSPGAGARFPLGYDFAAKHRVALLGPLDGQLTPRTDFQLRLTSPTLSRVMVDSTVVDVDANGSVSVQFKTGDAGSEVTVFGQGAEAGKSFSGLYQYSVK